MRPKRDETIDLETRTLDEDAPMGVVHARGDRFEIHLLDPMTRDLALQAVSGFLVQPLRMLGVPKFRETIARGQLGAISWQTMTDLKGLLRLKERNWLPPTWSAEKQADVVQFARARILFETAWAKKHPRRYGCIVLTGAYRDAAERYSAQDLWSAFKTELRKLDGQTVTSRMLRDATMYAKHAVERKSKS